MNFKLLKYFELFMYKIFLNFSRIVYNTKLINTINTYFTNTNIGNTLWRIFTLNSLIE